MQKIMSMGRRQNWEPSAGNYQFKDLGRDIETTVFRILQSGY